MGNVLDKVIETIKITIYSCFSKIVLFVR